MNGGDHATKHNHEIDWGFVPRQPCRPPADGRSKQRPDETTAVPKRVGRDHWSATCVERWLVMA